MDTLSIQKLKEKEKEERRNYIVDAAEKLFFSKGYDNVSMKDISDAVGISRAALYLYFKNKETVYFAVILRAAKIMNRMFKESVKSEKKGIDKIEDIGKAYFEFYNEFTDYHDAYLYFESQRFSKCDDEYASVIKALSNETTKVLYDVIVEGMEDGSIREDINPLEMAIYIATTSNRVVSPNSWALYYLKTQGISHEQYIEDAIGLWKRMLVNTEK